MTQSAPAAAPPSVDVRLPDQRSRIEQTLRGLPEITAARLVAGRERAVDELHILATGDKSPKQLVRDVQSLLLARFGLSVDRRVVSVVQLDDVAVDARARRSTVLRRLVTARDDGRFEVTATVEQEGVAASGRAVGADSQAGRLRATARATLASIGEFMSPDVVLELDAVGTSVALGSTVALVVVTLHTSTRELTLSGSAIVRRDEIDAVARAVLDSLNRALGSSDVQRPPPPELGPSL